MNCPAHIIDMGKSKTTLSEKRKLPKLRGINTIYVNFQDRKLQPGTSEWLLPIISATQEAKIKSIKV
jgi:hypothetical protein